MEGEHKQEVHVVSGNSPCRRELSREIVRVCKAEGQHPVGLRSLGDETTDFLDQLVAVPENKGDIRAGEHSLHSFLECIHGVRVALAEDVLVEWAFYHQCQK